MDKKNKILIVSYTDSSMILEAAKQQFKNGELLVGFPEEFSQEVMEFAKKTELSFEEATERLAQSVNQTCLSLDQLTRIQELMPIHQEKHNPNKHPFQKFIGKPKFRR